MAEPPARPLSRRTVLTGTGAVAVGSGLLATGCSSAGPASSAGAGGDDPGAGTPLGATAEVPVGSGTIFADQGVVVTQATAGSFAAYSTICPHQGCEVGSVTGAEIECPCHGSRFGLDGSVRAGPATRGLDAIAVSVAGDQIVLA